MKKILIPIIGLVALFTVMAFADVSSAEDGDPEPQADERTVIATVQVGNNEGDLVATIYDDGECVITGDATETYASSYTLYTGNLSNYRDVIKKITFDAPNLETINRGFVRTGYADRVFNLLTEIDWGNSPIKIINTSAILNCPNLVISKLPDTIERVNARSMTVNWGSDTIIIPPSCVRLEANAFQNVTGIKSVVIPQKCVNGYIWGQGQATAAGYAFQGTIETVTIYGEFHNFTTEELPIHQEILSSNMVQKMPSVSKIIWEGDYHVSPWLFYGIDNLSDKLEVDGDFMGFYKTDTYNASANVYNGEEAYMAVIKSTTVDLNIENETLNFDNVNSVMDVSGQDFILAHEFMVYPTDYETGTDTGVAGMILRLVPVFVLLAILGSVAYMFVNKRDL